MTQITNISELTTARCNTCGETKSRNEFHSEKRSKRGIRGDCKSCRKDKSYRDAYYIKKYGITLSEYDDMYSNQDGCCALCGRHQVEFKKRLHVDHCHITGNVRELLCQSCNTGIGSLKDDPELITKALEYLEKHNVI